MKQASRFSALFAKARQMLSRKSPDRTASAPASSEDTTETALNQAPPARKAEPPQGARADVSLDMAGLSTIVRSFSPGERTVFIAFAIIFVISALGAIETINRMFEIEIPAHGGALTEGVIGVPQFINPVLASSDTDRDLTELVYSGLLRATPSGDLVDDLAQSYTVSPDGLTYTFTLKPGLTWQDGQPITADDVVFTIQTVQDPRIGSPRRANWEGVTATKVDDHTVQFVLKTAYAPFLANATLGILPKHKWQNIDPEQFGFSTLNVSPTGSGPYEVRKVSKDASGIPLYYDLVPFDKFALGSPYLDRVRLAFYANENDLVAALQGGQIDAANALSAQATSELEAEGYRVERYTLPRVFGVFFNPTQNPVFADKAVRDALNLAINRGAIIHDVLDGYATPIDGPIAPGSLGYVAPSATATAALLSPNVDAANAELDAAGWTRGPDGIRVMKGAGPNKSDLRLAFSISTSDADELARSADIIRQSWQALGADVSVKVYKTSDLSESVIRPRNYDALFFGEIVGAGSDPFAFWDSSQKTDPGLNIAGYSSSAADKLLEAARVEQDPGKRMTDYQQFAGLVQTDEPAVFVYSPDFVYVVPKDLQGIESGSIATPSDRLDTVYEWYRESERIWEIFAPKGEKQPEQSAD